MHLDLPAGQVRIGRITVWIDEDADERVRIRLWPVTSGMQRACLASSELRRALVALLTAHGGLGLHLDRGDGSVAELWPRDEASVAALTAWVERG